MAPVNNVHILIRGDAPSQFANTVDLISSAIPDAFELRRRYPTQMPNLLIIRLPHGLIEIDGWASRDPEASQEAHKESRASTKTPSSALLRSYDGEVAYNFCSNQAQVLTLAAQARVDELRAQKLQRLLVVMERVLEKPLARASWQISSEKLLRFELQGECDGFTLKAKRWGVASFHTQNLLLMRRNLHYHQFSGAYVDSLFGVSHQTRDARVAALIDTVRQDFRPRDR